jgi:hypothetical protein
MKWTHFLVAAFIVSAALFKQGVPPLSIAGGIGAVALWNYMRSRSRRQKPAGV